MPSQRKPLSGHLSIRILAVAEVDHASTSRFSRGPETFVMMKVEDAFKGRTKATRTDKWADELHEFDIDKANEIEFTVYDKSGEHPQPIGMLWVRISDIAEEMRRKRIESEVKNSGWISADHMGDSGVKPDMQFSAPPGSSGAGSAHGSQQGPAGGASGGFGGGPAPMTNPVVIDDWFSLEPVGKIKLNLSFGSFLFSHTWLSALTRLSQTNTRTQTIRRWTRAQGRRSPAQGRRSRAVRSQVCAADFLQRHALLAVW